MEIRGTNRSRRYFAPLLALALFVSALAFVSADASEPNADAKRGARTNKNIVETAISAGNFTTLAKALEAAGLVEVLQGKGQFTVFAPTDEAFAKLPAGTLEELLKPENKDKLRSILLYHVVSGKVVATDVLKLNGKEAKTLQGGKVKINTSDGVMVNNARVVKADVMASNGVIHVIDTVLIPSATASSSKTTGSRHAARR